MMKLNELLHNVNGMLVGGCVRDKLMGKQPHDYDVITPYTPDEIRKLVPVAFNIGEKYGTLVVETGDCGFVEVTSARADIGDGRHPQVEFCESFGEDVKRRDFTMNALLMSHDGNVIDYVNGIDDINNRIIRTVGKASDRLNEDTLRALRAIRFKLQLGFELDEELQRELYNFNLKIGDKLSPNRVMDELKKMFDIDAAEAVILLDEFNLLKQILSEVNELHRCKENPKWHAGEPTTFIHTVRALNTLKDSKDATFEIKFAVLVHDIGKGIVRQGNATSYYGHDRAGALQMEAIAKRLCIPNMLRDMCMFVCENHMKMHQIENMRPFKRFRIYNHKYFWELYAVHLADTTRHNNAEHNAWILDDRERLMRNQRFITGNDVIALGVTGPSVGRILDKCFDAQLQEVFLTRDKGLEYLEWLIERMYE